jgi:hypothetical protein
MNTSVGAKASLFDRLKKTAFHSGTVYKRSIDGFIFGVHSPIPGFELSNALCPDTMAQSKSAKLTSQNMGMSLTSSPYSIESCVGN